jgi:hypothetical protein
LTDDFQQTPAGMMILFVGPKMFGQISDSLGQKSYLNLRGTGIAFMAFVLFDNFLFAIRGQHRATSFHTQLFEKQGYLPL